MKNILFILFCAFGLFLAIYYYLQFDKTKAELELANRRVLDRDTEIYQLQKKLGTFRLNPDKKSTTVVARPSSLGRLSVADENQLKKAGLKNPETDLKNHLLENQQQVLTQKGSLGGTMQIRDIQILNSRHALAYFEDGHNGGYLNLKYEVKPEGRINWMVLDAFVM